MKDRTEPARWMEALPADDPLREALAVARAERPDEARLERVYALVVGGGGLGDGGGGGGGDGGGAGGADPSAPDELGDPGLDPEGRSAPDGPDLPPPLVVPPPASAALAPAAGVTGTAAAFGATTLGKIVGVGAIGAASLATALWIGSPAADTLDAPSPRVVEAPAAVASARAEPIEPAATLPTRMPEQPPPAASTPAAPPPPPGSIRAGDPTAELALLREAQGAASSSPSRSLALLDEAEARFPRSGLAQERTVIRVQALIAAGRRDEALARARALLDGNPGTAHRPRLEQLLPELAR